MTLPASTQPSRARLWIVLAVVLPTLAIGAAAVLAAVLRHDDAPSGPSTSALVAACRAEIRDKLVAPATAQWPGDEVVEEAPASGEDVWRVDGAVDAENRFSALIRNYWTCFGAWRHGQWDIVTAEISQP